MSAAVTEAEAKREGRQRDVRHVHRDGRGRGEEQHRRQRGPEQPPVRVQAATTTAMSGGSVERGEHAVRGVPAGVPLTTASRQPAAPASAVARSQGPGGSLTH